MIKMDILDEFDFEAFYDSLKNNPEPTKEDLKKMNQELKESLENFFLNQNQTSRERIEGEKSVQELMNRWGKP